MGRFGIGPGGYKWANGIGSHDLRLPFTNAAWGRIDPNDVGIDEFCQFCALVGATPLVCVSFGDGAQSAGNLVQYCNGAANTTWGGLRATNGHPAPYAVPYFEIGNEINGSQASYLSQFASFVQAMKASDPAIQIMSSTPTQTLLTQQGTNMNFIDPHFYTTDLSDGTTNSVDGYLTALTAMINSNASYSNIMICTGEWNVSAGWGLGRAELNTLSTALTNANYLNVVMRHSDKVKMACHSGICNSFLAGFIQTSMSGLGVNCQPAYYVMQLYASNTTAKPLPLTVSQPGGGLDVFACASTNYQSVTIFVVNENTGYASFSFSFTGFSNTMGAVSAQSVYDTQNVGETDVGNHWPAPARVQLLPLAVAQSSVALPPLSVTAIQCGQAATAPPPMLTHRYSFFNNTANDSVGTANGTLHGATVSGGLLNLNGSGWMTLPAQTLGANYTNGLSVEVWTTVSSTADGTSTAIWGFGNTTDYGQIYTHDTGNDSYVTYTSSSETVSAFQPGPVAGTVQLTGVWNPVTGDLLLYENGKLVENNVMAGLPLTLMTGANNLTNVLGAGVNGSPMTGSIQEFRIYSGELTPDEIQTSIAAGAGNAIISPGTIESVSVAVHPNFIVGAIQDPVVCATSATVANINLTTAAVCRFFLGNANILAALGRAGAGGGGGETTLTATYQGVSGQTKVITMAAPTVLMTHRYSFVSNANDSVGGENGALMGGASASNGLKMSISLGNERRRAANIWICRGTYRRLSGDVDENVGGFKGDRSLFPPMEFWRLRCERQRCVRSNDVRQLRRRGAVPELEPQRQPGWCEGYDNLPLAYSDDKAGQTTWPG